MEQKTKSWVSLAALMFLAACECCDDSVKTEEAPVVVEDDSLAKASADFIAEAGDRVFYDFDKSSLSKESEATLERQANWLKNHPNRNLLIEGHCDERGTREYNLGLGERRADAAARYLTDHGVESTRIRTISFGKDRQIAAEGSKKDVYAANRVAISVVE